MNRKIGLGSIILLVLLVLAYKYSSSVASSSKLLDKILFQDGYAVQKLKQPVTVELFIKPEWIPFEPKTQKSVNTVIKELNNTKIILDHVWNRGNDIYFNFTTKIDLSSDNGEFLYNNVINNDRTLTNFGGPNDFALYDKQHRKIELGQSGYGPNSDFSFGIEPNNQNLIRDGFYVRYSGFILYAFTKVQS